MEFSRCGIAFTTAFILILSLLGCREKEIMDEGRPQEVVFSISAIESSRQASTSSISQVTQAIVTITKSDGNTPMEEVGVTKLTMLYRHRMVVTS